MALALAVAVPWLVLHMPVGPTSAYAVGYPTAILAGNAPPARSTDGIRWSMGGSLVLPPLVVTPPNTEKRRELIHYQATEGDTLRALAAKYGLSVNTLLWSNPHVVDQLPAGQEVLIPPVDGVLVTLTSDDSVQSLATKYHAETDAIIEFNFLRHPEKLSVGGFLMVPYGVGPEAAPAPKPVAQELKVGRRTWPVQPIWSAGGGMYPFGQCTWYANQRHAAPWGGNAWEWYGRARLTGHPVGPTPRQGAIQVSWENAYWGHVAFVERVYADGSWLVSEMNYYDGKGGGWGVVSYRHVVPGTIPVIGFVY
jgi:LysM repeat protein